MEQTKHAACISVLFLNTSLLISLFIWRFFLSTNTALIRLHHSMIAYLMTLLLCTQIVTLTPNDGSISTTGSRFPPIELPKVDDPEHCEFWIQIPCSRRVPVEISAITANSRVRLTDVRVYGKIHVRATKWFKLPESVELEDNHSRIVIEAHHYTTRQPSIYPRLPSINSRFIVVTHSYVNTGVMLSLEGNQAWQMNKVFNYIAIRRRYTASAGAATLSDHAASEPSNNQQAKWPASLQDLEEFLMEDWAFPDDWACSDEV